MDCILKGNLSKTVHSLSLTKLSIFNSYSILEMYSKDQNYSYKLDHLWVTSGSWGVHFNVALTSSAQGRWRAAPWTAQSLLKDG